MRDGLRELIYSGDDTAARHRFGDARPIPIYSCWNGMIVMDARPFVAIRLDGKFRKGKAPVRFRPANRRKGECGKLAPFVLPYSRSLLWHLLTNKTLFNSLTFVASLPAASECKLIAKDFWKRGFNRWLVRTRCFLATVSPSAYSFL